VTAAYGNLLPAAFLALPARGTLNVHPSLLPAYRGAAPVQRALQARPPSSGRLQAAPCLHAPLDAPDMGPALACWCMHSFWLS